jgi:hypothetical protein
MAMSQKQIIEKLLLIRIGRRSHRFVQPGDPVRTGQGGISGFLECQFHRPGDRQPHQSLGGINPSVVPELLLSGGVEFRQEFSAFGYPGLIDARRACVMISQ